MASVKKITLDGDKGLWTVEEVENLLKEAGLNVEVTKKDGDTHDTKVIPADPPADTTSDTGSDADSAGKDAKDNG